MVDQVVHPICQDSIPDHPFHINLLALHSEFPYPELTLIYVGPSAFGAADKHYSFGDIDIIWKSELLTQEKQMQTHPIQNALAIILGFTVAPANAALVTNSFDGYSHGTVLRDQLAGLGAIFSSPSAEDAPTVYGFFPSPVSPRNYLIGENEGEIDLNPSSEFGNNRSALPITITFVDPVNPAVPGITSFVSFRDVFVNLGSITRAEAFGPNGALLLSETRAGQGGRYTSLFALSHEGIHQVTVSFGVSGSTAFEDHAGIDDITFATVVPLSEPSTFVLLTAGLLGGCTYRRWMNPRR